jgi:cell wall-associated NlpC family hydrolase
MLTARPTTATQNKRILFACVLVLMACNALANPAPIDGVSRYLIDNGMLTAPAANETPPPKAESPIVTRIRDTASDMVITAMNFLGVPYQRGGNSAERGFDCSGFTRHVFEMSVGLVLPRRVDEQATAPGLIVVKRDELKPGDLVFFNTLKRTFSHVGIYVGEGKFIHAPRTGGEVRVEDMRFAYWAKRFTGARRAEPTLAISVPEGAAAAPVVPVLLNH